MDNNNSLTPGRGRSEPGLVEIVAPGSMYRTMLASPAHPPRASAQRFLTFLRRRWWILALSLAFFGGLGAAYIRYFPETYVSTGLLEIPTKLRLRDAAAYEDQSPNTQLELLQSKSIQARAIALIESSNTVSPNRIIIPRNFMGQPDLPKVVPKQLSRSGVIQVQAKGPEAQYVQGFLDALMKAFLAYSRETRTAAGEDTLASVDKQVKDQEAALTLAQNELNDYGATNNLAVLEEQAKTAGAVLIQLRADLSRLILEEKTVEATDKAIQRTPSAFKDSLAEVTNMFNQDALGTAPESFTLQQGIERLKIRRARFGQVFQDRHPKMVQLNEEISQQEELLKRLERHNEDHLDRSKQALGAKIAAIKESIREWEGIVTNASVRIAGAQRLKMKLDRVQAFDDRLKTVLQSVEFTKNLTQGTAQILDQASAAKAQKLSPPVVSVIALILGLAAGFGLVLVVERCDDSITSLDDLNGRFQERVLGQVPNMPRFRKKGRAELLSVNDPRHGFSESLRSLRSAIQFRPGADANSKVLLVTSALPDEGKSTLAANLARALAFAGNHVLLIDGDLRRGLLHQLFKTAQEPGLSDALADGADPSAFAVRTNLPNLSLLPRGKDAGNAGELFLSENFDRLLERARAEYDCVIMDSIPVFAANDTTTVAPKVDGVLFVIRGSYTASRTARRALEMLYQRQTRILGLVFNRADASARWYKDYKFEQYYTGKKAAKMGI